MFPSLPTTDSSAASLKALKEGDTIANIGKPSSVKGLCCSIEPTGSFSSCHGSHAFGSHAFGSHASGLTCLKTSR
jgi:hypothetical protein